MKIYTPHGLAIQVFCNNFTWIIAVMAVFVSVTPLIAQNDVIEPMSSSSVSSLLSSDKVTNIRILSATDELLTVEVRYEGYNEEDARYYVKGEIQNKNKQTISEISSDAGELSKNAQAVDLTFRMSDYQKSSTPYIESKYIAIGIQKTSNGSEDEEGGLLDGLSELFGADSDSGSLGGLLGDVYLFQYPKTWRVAGNENMTISVNLTPIGKAAQNH